VIRKGVKCWARCSAVSEASSDETVVSKDRHDSGVKQKQGLAIGSSTFPVYGMAHRQNSHIKDTVGNRTELLAVSGRRYHGDVWHFGYLMNNSKPHNRHDLRDI
jgi:hypothetical protein